ncbi:MAG: hypothetical protein JNL62_18565, partial [Bryobacterales bacterium]|nr:hypothetical protein [Bryobacterales bacterium]
MSWVAGVICVLGWTMVGSAQIPGYTISPTSTQLSSLQTQQTVVVVPQSSSTPFQFQTTVTTMNGAAWLVAVPQSIGPAVGVQAFTVVANLSGLVVGLTYTGTVRVTIGGLWQDVSVTLTVGAPSPGASFILNPSLVNLNSSQPTQVVNIFPSGTAVYSYMTTTIAPTGGTWLSVNPASGTATAATNFTVIANPAGLQAGVHVGTVRVVVNNWQQDLPVTFTVSSGGGASFQVTPTSLSFEYTRGGSLPPLQQITIQSSSAMIYTASIANATADFLRVSPP